MIDANSEHSEKCWTWEIPADFVPTPPRFRFGQLVPLGDWHQDRPGVTQYGQIRGIFWDVIFEFWRYTIQPPLWHPRADDLDEATEEEVIDRLRAAKN